ncbi:hypothetical protein CCAX7_62140 [Capsulimonas corticalis]|uniref:Uncharacterized protein n=1 Tax=Capsulimonas corticalis TaxID=2219043 RepID=A0A402CWF2_9BACT|nr:hypothetical protein [Capsulimonas corticalis]BDI34163.1 hypothetical protein CCAX7_62140 [Capsulimonas corticalis]
MPEHALNATGQPAEHLPHPSTPQPSLYRKEEFLAADLTDKEILKDIFEEGTKRHDGKYSSALFGKNFDLVPSQIDEVGKLIDITKSNLDRLIRAEPLWQPFQVLLEERRQKFGGLGESNGLVEDPDADAVSKSLINGKIPAILLPTRVKRLYDWNDLVMRTERTLHDYVAGKRDGNSAVDFAEALKELYRFNRELAKHN